MNSGSDTDLAAEAAPRPGEAKYKALFENAGAAIFIADAETGAILDGNKKAEWLAGKAKAELIGMDLAKLHPSGQAEYYKQQFRDCVSGGSAVLPDALVERKDGTRVPVQISAAVLEIDGRKVVQVLFDDISDRKRLEDEHEMKAMLLDSVKDAVFLHDLEGRIVYSNEAAYVQLGYAADSMNDMMFKQLLTPGSAGEFAAQTQHAASLGEAVFESEYLRTDGGIMHAETRAHAVELYGEKFILRVVRDITARKEAEQAQRRLLNELEKINGEISQFNSLIAHDLQVPMRMIESYSQQLKKRLAGKLDAEDEEFLGYIMNGGRLMQKMLEDLMRYLHEGANPEKLQEVDMNKVMGRVLLLLRASLEETRAEVSCGRLPVIFADRAQMTHLLQNLVDNAIKFKGADAPRISVSCAAAEEADVFTVRDNGIGIDPQFFERVFKIFQRLHTREEYPGTGVGLSLCRKIVENHGGRIWVESEPGKGAVFSFSLPRRNNTRALT
ncbi:MAG: PAS domain S-box protein [Elusimicrobiota bacterium]|nr:PAS domain S-box protein [Elusimicrobiota bacterium]